MKRVILIIVTAASLLLAGSCNNPKWEESQKEGYILISQKKGAQLGYSKDSGISILYDKGFAFKDLNRNGIIDPYEDWRLSCKERAKNLASDLSIEEIAGLMLYSMHQAVPTDDYGYWGSTYNGTTLAKSGLPKSAVSDKQKKFLSEDNLRAILLVRTETPRMAAEWNNNLQSFCEGIGHGIPVNISSDPRHETEARAEFNAGSGGKISLWPCQLGLAATFDPQIVRQFGDIASKEYRALGIATALSPQADIATEPRWFRNYGTFGEDPRLAADMTKAYIDGFQTSCGKDEIEDGWGYESVNAMVKHWPGGGAGEGGRDAHYSFGKYSVYPGNDLEQQLIPFTEGAFKLDGKTKMASAVMPYYTISYGIDPSGKNVGNSYSEYIIKDMLREGVGYDGVVCTDWAITHDYYKVEDANGKPWGREDLTEGERHFEVIKAGVDQFGGNNDAKPVIEAYHIWEEKYGKESARERFELSAVRLLMNMFRTGLFDNPYRDPNLTEKIVGAPEYMEAGYNAQLQSVVMLKNHEKTLPIKDSKKKVYFPKKHIGAFKGFFGPVQNNDKWEYPIDTALVAKYWEITDKPEEADFAYVAIGEPFGPQGYDIEDRKNGGNGYIPISLQYSEYTAEAAREESIAGGDPNEDFTNRSYKDKTVRVYNAEDADLVKTTREKMGNKPVIVSVSCLRPFVMKDIEPYADAIVIGFCVQHQAFLDILSGKNEPNGLLPVQMPADMKTVERQCEDSPGDMRCYRDADEHVYDFAYGMNWDGVINDARVQKYAPSRDAKGEMPFGKLLFSNISTVNTQGWIKEYLDRQVSGMSGHPEALSYPYDSNLWDGEIVRNTESYGSDWWRYEQTAYYTDGLIRLAYLLNDKELIAKAEKGIKYTLEHQNENGRLPHTSFGNFSQWPLCVFFRALEAYDNMHPEAEVAQKLDRHYMTMSIEELEFWRNIVSIEGMLWTYARTGNQQLLIMAEEAWNAGNFIDLTPKRCALDHIPFMHGVTWCEEVKLPLLLYSYTGKQRYLDLALNAMGNIEEDHMLPDGVHVSAEALFGNQDIRNSHETCDIADFTWSLGYFLAATGDAIWGDKIERAVFNAAPGAVTKDFKALQYFSSVNQVISTGNSNQNVFFHGSTWMAYRPTHETECCAGNVHRIIPNYAARMWMRDKNEGIVAALYGPSEYRADFANGNVMTIREETNYPFDESIRFHINTKRPITTTLSLRIPQWCQTSSIQINGESLDVNPQAGTFFPIKRKFKDGDEIIINFPMKAQMKDFKEGVFVERGPILYSYAVPQNKVEDKNIYANMNGKVPGNDEFKCWAITPAGDWNYAIATTKEDFEKTAIVSVDDEFKGFPFELGAAPVSITVPAMKIKWTLEDNRYTPKIPQTIIPTEKETEMIKLIPYGATELRLTVFPKYNKQ